LAILPALAGTVVVPPAVVQELEERIKLGVNLPNLASLSWLTVILDDGLARRVAMLRNIPLTGTLGLLLNAKQVGLVAQLEPLINKLQVLGFRVSAGTRRLILQQAGEI
jgi:predicted nucleic acid-binding protein